MSLNFISNFISTMTLTGTISIVTVFSAVISAITNYFYKSNCEKIYGINKSNFTFNDKFELLLISLGSIFMSSLFLEYLSDFILNSDTKRYISITISLILLYFVNILMYQFLDKYVFDIKTDKISNTNRFSAILFALVYYIILLIITGSKYFTFIYKIFTVNDLTTFNSIISTILFYSSIILTICILSIIFCKLNKKECKHITKCIIKLFFIMTFGTICSVSLFYTTVLFSTSNAAKKVEYDLNNKISSGFNRADDKAEENWLTNRATEIKNFPLKYMTAYFKNPIRLYNKEFIEDYKKINGTNIEDDKIEKFNNEKSKFFNKTEKQLKKEGIYDEAIRIVRVSYFVNIFNENDNTISYSSVGLFICIFIIPLLLMYTFDPKRKKEYEIIEDKYAIISKIDGYAIALNCTIENNNDERILFIEKSNKYKIFKFDLDQKIENIKFKSVEIIEKHNEKECIDEKCSNSTVEKYNEEECSDEECSNSAIEKYNAIFGNGFVDTKPLIEDKSDVININTINEVVEYIKSQGEKIRIESLSLVKATKEEYDNKVKMCINDGSFFAYILALVATTELIYKFTNSKIVENIGFWLVASVLLFIIWGVLLMFERKFKKYNKIIKYLTYLEQQLGSNK